MYEGTKFGQPDEFDLMVVIDGSEDIVRENMTPGYARLRAKQHPSLPLRFSRCLDGDQHINPTKMLDWFYGLVQKGVNKVNIKEGYDLSIDVDLVLCIQLDDQYYVAKPYKDYADEPPQWSLRIESCLRERRLPHFCLPELNLLDGIRRETTENMRYRIKRLIDSEHERNKVLYVP
uniref:Uncharacterized protein n=1 Tax=Branchiostoma floridae TaxID=7739 RepID=C3YLL8_BRAFL|eukprot:XP_002602775.1 hypothetical protein BRAFLDRAFT_93721 [Branchiostoma floridae]